MARDDLYSNVILWVKVTLPIVALALLSSLFLLSGSPDPDEALPYADIDLEQVAQEQRLTEPRFAGVVGDDRQLILNAESVAAQSDRMDLIFAQTIDGTLELSMAGVMTLHSSFGNIDMMQQSATLTEDVTVRDPRGYQLDSDTMLVALDEVHLRSPSPVHVTGPGLDLRANEMEMTEVDGEPFVRFTGSVRMLYDPEN